MSAALQTTDDLDLHDLLPFRLAVAAEGVSRLMAQDVLGQFDLSQWEWRVMEALAQLGAAAPTVIAAHTAMDKVKTSRATSTLVRRGILKETHDPKDGRGKLLRLTAKGVALRAGIKPRVRQYNAALAAMFTASEWGVLNRTLGSLMVQRSVDDSEMGEA